jgi:hypothetical protein
MLYLGRNMEIAVLYMYYVNFRSIGLYCSVYFHQLIIAESYKLAMIV